MMRRARDISRQEGINNAEYLVADADQLPFADGKFDLVVSRYSLHHFHDPSRVLKEVRRVLKAWGHVLLEDIIAPEDHTKQSYLNAVQRTHDPSHVKTLTKRELEDILRSLFKIEDE